MHTHIGLTTNHTPPLSAEAAFKDGSVSNGVNVGGKKLPSTPGYNVTLGMQLSRTVRTVGKRSSRRAAKKAWKTRSETSPARST
jgi:hypothetical protein